MAPSIDVLPYHSDHFYDPRTVHVTKKRKIHTGGQVHDFDTSLDSGVVENGFGTQDEDNATSVPPHPWGIRPSGNVYDAKFNLMHSCRLFAQLPEELLLEILEFLDAKQLQVLGATCKALSAYCASEELWKTLFTEYAINSCFEKYQLI